MNFSQLPPSKQWAALKYHGEVIAEVWFKPEGEPFGLTFRIPQKSFQIPDLDHQLTLDNLLRAVGVPAAEVESWHHEGAADPGPDAPTPEPAHPLPLPRADVAHLTLHITLKLPPQEAAAAPSAEREITEGMWQELEARWKAILGVEAGMDALRMTMEGLRSELEGSTRRTLNMEEKINALNADVAEWNKAKSRVHYALPKVKEFIHRSTWATGTPERKKLEELFKNHIQPRVPFPHVEKVVEQLESLLKDRQILSAQGNAVFQECKNISAQVQGALSNLQRNAKANATRKRGADQVRKGRFI